MLSKLDLGLLPDLLGNNVVSVIFSFAPKDQVEAVKALKNQRH
ncbi:hypothetical protein AsAng_0002190 [Aureispira anguillae]|uniref:Uncharacterized protein n=1 Tax=Aureispira anguillae TaxID=2864201 RepID=A0A915Y9I8_9BACT|nr:hypothetical protein AsAng_0002190 [Aureispira anguillae]